MKQVWALPFVFAAGLASADETTSIAQFHRTQGTTSGDYTHKASGSYLYQWDGTYQMQADMGITSFSGGGGTDTSIGVHGSYNITYELTAGAYAGWETFNALSDDYYYFGLEASYHLDNMKIQFYTRNQGTSIPAFDNIAYGGNAELVLSDAITLVGRGVVQDNDGEDRFTTVIGAGIDYTMPNGLTLSGELVTWNKRVNWVPDAGEQSITLGAKYIIGDRAGLFPDRSSVSTLFGSDILPIY